MGWDVAVHLEMLQHWPWEAWDVRSSFYAYHPPLAFFLARIISFGGLSSIQSVQAVAFLASMAGFFFLRLLVRHLGMLEKSHGIAFLYVTSSLPVLINLSYSITIDVLLYAALCAVLLFSFRLSEKSYIPSVGLCASFLFAMFVKFSFVLLLPIPFMVIGLQWQMLERQKTKRRRMVVRTFLAIVISAAIASPYYVGRYYVQERTLFPSNMDFEEYGRSVHEEQRRTVRDSDRVAFVRDFFRVSIAELLRLQDRDQERVRIINTWRDFWAGNKYNVTQTPLSLSLSHIYSFAALFLIALGTIRFIQRFRLQSEPWDQFGVVLLGLSIMCMFSLFLYPWKYPHPVGLLTKLIYVMPLVLGTGWILSFPAGILSSLPKKFFAAHLICVAFGFLLGAFIVLNHILPVY